MQDIDHAMNDLNGVIHQLSERTEEIGGIASAITDIAKETSLLSLNASIEAREPGSRAKDLRLWPPKSVSLRKGRKAQRIIYQG